MKKTLYIISGIVVVFLVIICLGTKENNKNAMLIESKSTSKNFGSSAISMMYETEAGSGVYEVSTDNSWPTSGYTFNETLSKCENGSTLTWNEETKTVLMQANSSDKCYVYFDKLSIKLTLNNYTFSWNVIDEAESYNIYSDDELLTSTTENSIEIYEYFSDAGTYEIKASYVDANGNEAFSENTISYTLEKAEPINAVEITEGLSKEGASAELITPNSDVVYVNAIKLDELLIASMAPSAPSGLFNVTPNVNFCSYYNQYCEKMELLSFESYVYTVHASWSKAAKAIKYDSDLGQIRILNVGNVGEVAFSFQLIVPGMAPSEWIYSKNISIMCVSENTFIYVYDEKKKKFKKKKIKFITYDDKLLVWDFDNACFAIAKPLWIKKKETTDKYNLLKFSDGSTLETINQHRIFNAEKGMFTYPMTDDTPIGTTTFNAQGESVTLVSKEVIYKNVNYYNIITYYHMNLFTNNILTSCRLNNIYPIENMKFVKDNRRLKTKEEFKNVSQEWYGGLRLSEQPEDINRGNATLFKSIEDYIKNLEEKKK